MSGKFIPNSGTYYKVLELSQSTRVRHLYIYCYLFLKEMINIPFENPFVKKMAIFFLQSFDSSRNNLLASRNASDASFTLNVFGAKSSSNDNISGSSLYSFSVMKVSTYFAYVSRANRVFERSALNVFTNFEINIFISRWHFQRQKNCWVASITKIMSVFLAPNIKTRNWIADILIKQIETMLNKTVIRKKKDS